MKNSLRLSVSGFIVEAVVLRFASSFGEFLVDVLVHCLERFLFFVASRPKEDMIAVVIIGFVYVVASLG